MRSKVSKVRKLYKDFKSLKKSIERNTNKLKLSLETELMLFTHLDNINKLLEELERLDKR
jgi:hypothetical protein